MNTENYGYQHEDRIKIAALWGDPERNYALTNCWISDYGPVQGSRYIRLRGRYPNICVDIRDLWAKPV